MINNIVDKLLKIIFFKKFHLIYKLLNMMKLITNIKDGEYLIKMEWNNMGQNKKINNFNNFNKNNN